MNYSVDRRIIRTKKAIRQALVSLIEEKGFDALSVKDIAVRANINRGTFYLHYQDKFDLMDQTLEDISRDIEGILMEITHLSPADFASARGPFTIIRKLFAYFRENAPLVQAVLATKGNNALQEQIKKIMEHNLFEKNYTTFIRKENLQVPAEYLMAYIAAAHLGVVQEWLDKGCQETPEEMAEILSRLTFRGPLFAAGITPSNRKS